MSEAHCGWVHRSQKRGRAVHNLANVKGVGAGVLEYRIDCGPGYRVYFGRDGDVLVILLGGGTKKRQQKDIEAAQKHWKDYRQRKRQEN